ASTFGDNHKVDDHQNGEDHHPHGVVTANHHLTEGLNHLTGGVTALMAMQQHHPGGGDVKRQPQQRGHQQHRRENGKVHRPHGVDTLQQHHNGERDIEGKEDVEQERGNGQGHHAQDDDHQQRNPQISSAQASNVV